MKHFVARCLTLCALLGPVALAPLVAPAPAYSLNDDQIQAKLKEVPGFVLARQDGQPLTITTKDKDGKPEATLLPVYMVPKAAEESLKNLQTSNPQLGKEARILVVSLAQVQALFMEAVKKDPKFAILLTPDQAQMQAAIPILKAQGLKDEDIKNLGMFVPVFFSEITLTVPDASGKPKVVAPFFFENQAATNIISQAKKQNADLAKKDLKVQAAPLSAILQQLKEAKPDSSWADVQLIPTEEAIAFARKLQGTGSNAAAPAPSK